MAVGTITSRITRVLRDITIAAALGSAILADTYALGNSLPNIIYILVIGGALNAVFIPQLVRHMRSDGTAGMDTPIGSSRWWASSSWLPQHWQFSSPR